MNISDVYSKVVLPVELLATVPAWHRLNLPVDKVGVSVESTLVFRLERALVAVKGEILMFLKNVILQFFPHVKFLEAIFAFVNLMISVDMFLQLVLTDVLIVTVLTLTQHLLLGFLQHLVFLMHFLLGFSPRFFVLLSWHWGNKADGHFRKKCKD